MLPSSHLEGLIAIGYSEGLERYGDLGLDQQTYADRVCSIIRKHLGPAPPEHAAISFVSKLHGRDLYLATACAQEGAGLTANGSSGPVRSCVAWKTLGVTYKAFIHDLARLFFRQSYVAQDLADNLLADLFLPDSSGSSRILSYDGRSSLCTWLRVVICNRAINARRSKAYSQTTEIELNTMDRPALAKLDQAICLRRYGARLADSVALACNELTPEERLLLLWRYEDGLQLGQIAELLGIHQSNVTRRLERMQTKLREHIIAILAKKYSMSGPAIQECLSDIVENPRNPISILDLIKMSGIPGNKTSMPASHSS